MKLLCILRLKHETSTIISTYADIFLIVKEGYIRPLVTSRGHRHRMVESLIREAKSGENCVLPYL